MRARIVAAKTQTAAVFRGIGALLPSLPAAAGMLAPASSTSSSFETFAILRRLSCLWPLRIAWGVTIVLRHSLQITARPRLWCMAQKWASEMPRSTGARAGKTGVFPRVTRPRHSRARWNCHATAPRQAGPQEGFSMARPCLSGCRESMRTPITPGKWRPAPLSA